MTPSLNQARKLLPVLLAGAALTFGCSDDDKASTRADGSISGDPGGSVLRDGGLDGGEIDSSIGLPGGDSGLEQKSDGSVVTSLSNGQIVAALGAVNKAVLDQGYIAASKAQRADVKDYAKTVVEKHTQAQVDQTALGITPADSAVSVMLVGNAATVLTELEAAPADQTFDYKYVASQAMQQDVALKLIDTQLLVDVSAVPLREELQKTRTAVQANLDAALALKAKLSPDGGTL